MNPTAKQNTEKKYFWQEKKNRKTLNSPEKIVAYCTK